MMTPAAIVACNIYITAASSHSSTLLSLLRRAQDQCRQLRHQHKDDFERSASGAAEIKNALSRSSSSNIIAPIAIVHAYADIPYDRSSFHLSGTPDCVSAVASRLICNALNEIDVDCTNPNSNRAGQSNETRHPFVGLVDHVSVMSIDQDTPSNDNDNNSNCEAAAKAAREIGKRISATNLVNVHYYGRACPNNTSLATVRRESTSFFKSGGAIDGKEQSSKDIPAISKTLALQGDTTIGTPSNFVENLNIRLTSNVNFEQAKTLTQFVRGRNISTKGYGVPGVEALTLPYVREISKGGNVYEVACNLTTPKEGSADDIKMQLDQWIEKQKQQSSDVAKVLDYEYFVEDAYPVGTTEEQCKQVLSQAYDMDNEEYWRKYDREILDNFQELLQN